MAVHFGLGETKVVEDRRGNVNQRGSAMAGTRDEVAARDEEERALLVLAEAAMLAEAGGVLGLQGVAHDGAVAGHAVRIGPVVGLER